FFAIGINSLHSGQCGETNKRSCLRPEGLPIASGAPSKVTASITGAASPTAGPLPVTKAPAGASRICKTPICRAKASSATPRPRITSQEKICETIRRVSMMMPSGEAGARQRREKIEKQIEQEEADASRNADQ